MIIVQDMGFPSACAGHGLDEVDDGDEQSDSQHEADGLRPGLEHQVERVGQRVGEHRAQPVRDALGALIADGPVALLRVLDRLDERRGADRQSTRLNSSHVKTSYAVFCLKKKTTTDPTYSS